MISMSITLDADITIEINHSNDEPVFVEMVVRRERCAAVRVPLPWRVAEILAGHLGVAAEMAEEAEDDDEDDDDEDDDDDEEAGDGA